MKAVERALKKKEKQRFAKISRDLDILKKDLEKEEVLEDAVKAAEVMMEDDEDVYEDEEDEYEDEDDEYEDEDDEYEDEDEWEWYDDEDI